MPSKIKSTVVLLFSLCFVFSSSSYSEETNDILVTIKPLHSLVSGVLGNTGKAHLLVTGSSSPHDFQLKPSQIKLFQEASIIFYIDDSFETFLRRVFKTLPKGVKKSAVAKMSRITILPFREGGLWEGHDHGEHKDEEHDDHAEEQNMHVWLAAANAKKIVKSITKELSAIFPENRNAYKRNAKNYIARLDKLEEELKASTAKAKDLPFIVFHDAYQYFEKAYELRAIGSILVDPHEAPSPNRLKEIRQKLTDSEATCIFSEPQFPDRLLKTVTRGTQTKTGILDPLGADIDSGESMYFELMRQLANNIKGCLVD